MRLSTPAGRLITVVLAALAIVFLTLTLRSNWQALQAHQWEVRPVRGVLSVIALTGVFLWGTWVWSRVLRMMEGADVLVRDLVRIWFLSNLARYIPGKMWHLVGVAHLARGAAIPATLLVTSVFVHVAFTMLAAGAIGAAFYPYDALGFHSLKWIVPVTAIVGAVAATHPRFLNAALGLVARVARRDTMSWTGSWLESVKLLGFYVLSWLIYGAAFYLFVSAIVPIELSAIPSFVAVSALSFLAGYLSPLPGGLGLREAALTVLLKPFVPVGVSALIAIGTRLWTILAEVVGAIAVLIFIPRSRQDRDDAEGQQFGDGEPNP